MAPPVAKIYVRHWAWPDPYALWLLISEKVLMIRAWNFQILLTQVLKLCYLNFKSMSLIVWKLCAFRHYRYFGRKKKLAVFCPYHPNYSENLNFEFSKSNCNRKFYKNELKFSRGCNIFYNFNFFSHIFYNFLKILHHNFRLNRKFEMMMVEKISFRSNRINRNLIFQNNVLFMNINC